MLQEDGIIPATDSINVDHQANPEPSVESNLPLATEPIGGDALVLATETSTESQQTDQETTALEVIILSLKKNSVRLSPRSLAM